MKTIKLSLIASLTLLFFSCSASRSVPVENEVLNEMMENKSFEINMQTAEPQVTQALAQIASSGMLPPGNTISRIDVAGAGYFVKVYGDSVSANLPYYGERRMAGGYGSDGGIQFHEHAKNLEITKDINTLGYNIKFSSKDASESYLVNAEVLPNLKCTTIITSSQRNRIRYSGKLSSSKKN